MARQIGMPMKESLKKRQELKKKKKNPEDCNVTET